MADDALQHLEVKSGSAQGRCPDGTPKDRLIRAAERCFVESGFHGARMAQIAKEARMSPGHVYHYFSSKEQLIEEIIRGYTERKLEGLDEMRRAEGSIMQRLIDGLAEGLATHADPFWSRLTLEITTEAARNPEIAKIVRDADLRLQEEFVALVSDEIDLQPNDPRHEVFVALIQGIGLRKIRNPDLDMAAVTATIQDTMRFLFGPKKIDA